MRELRRDQHAAVATRRHRSLLVQCLRTLPQDEWHESAADQAEQKTGELRGPFWLEPLLTVFLFAFSFIANRDETLGLMLHQLRHPNDNAVASEQRGRTGLQRLWVVL